MLPNPICMWCGNPTFTGSVSVHTLEEQTPPEGGHVNSWSAVICETAGCRARGPIRRTTEEAREAYLVLLKKLILNQ